jgi:hypothetical protein
MTAASRQDELIDKYAVPILCDRATYDSAKEAVEFKPLPPQQIKGRTEPVEVFHALEAKKSVVRSKTELIGRQEEKTMIATALQELSRGLLHQTLILQGEAGIGKSRLFEDLIRQAETLDVKTFIGSGDGIEKSSPYHAWRPVFDKVFEIEDFAAKGDFSEERKSLRRSRVRSLKS